MSFNNYIYSITQDSSGNLYVGGGFTTVGGSTVNYVAKWNGTGWESLGSGLDSLVTTMVTDSSGNLYVGGYFTTAGGVSANRIAKWNGTSWSSFGTGMNANLWGIALDPTDSDVFYAIGNFSTANGVSAVRIAKWNGTQFVALGSGLNSTGRCVACDSYGNLYAGGSFITAGGVTVNGIAKWDNTQWNAMGSGVAGTVYSIGIDSSDTIYAGTGQVNRWDDPSWTNIGLFGGPIRTIVFDSSGILYAGGQFTRDAFGGNAVLRTAKWNGSFWEKFIDTNSNVMSIFITDPS